MNKVFYGCFGLLLMIGSACSAEPFVFTPEDIPSPPVPAISEVPEVPEVSEVPTEIVSHTGYCFARQQMKEKLADTGSDLLFLGAVDSTDELVYVIQNKRTTGWAVLVRKDIDKFCVVAFGNVSHVDMLFWGDEI
jgi:hypothetical protein